MYIYHHIVNFEKVDPPKHEGKILIMVDEKDSNKIIARDLLTNKTAEAKCSPKDEWDFNKGAKLALERLMEPEKPKYWTGKVVLVKADADTQFFTVGKVYKVKDGELIDDSGTPYGNRLFMSLDDLNNYFRCDGVGNRQFIEYKGGAEEPEKPKYWTGKVALVNADTDALDNYLTVGKVYSVKDGKLIDNAGRQCCRHLFTSFDDLNNYFHCNDRRNRQFIEYVGEDDE